MKNAESGCSLRRPARSGPAGREMRAFAAGGCGPLRFHSEPQIQNSRFKIQDYKIGPQPAERTPSSGTNCGPPPDEDCGPPIAARLILWNTSPQPSGRACDVEEQPSAWERLRAVGRYRDRLLLQNTSATTGGCELRRFLAGTANEKSRMRNRAAACGGTARADASCGPPPGGGCGPPIAARLIPTQAPLKHSCGPSIAARSIPTQAPLKHSRGPHRRPKQRSDAGRSLLKASFRSAPSDGRTRSKPRRKARPPCSRSRESVPRCSSRKCRCGGSHRPALRRRSSR